MEMEVNIKLYCAIAVFTRFQSRSQDKPQMEMDGKYKAKCDFIWTERFSFEIDGTDLNQAWLHQLVMI